jgi:hypothetical protein
MVVVFSVYMVGVAMLTLAERKISAWIQAGSARIAWAASSRLLQPAADGVKNIMKEETLPEHVNKPVFMLCAHARVRSRHARVGRHPVRRRGTRAGAASRWSSRTFRSASCSRSRSRR